MLPAFQLNTNALFLLSPQGATSSLYTTDKTAYSCASSPPLTHQLYAVEIITFAYIFAYIFAHIGFLLPRLCRFMGIFRQAGPRLLPNTNTAFCFPISLQKTCSKGAVTLTVVWWNFVEEIQGKKMGIYPIWSFTWGWKCSNGSNQWSPTLINRKL